MTTERTNPALSVDSMLEQTLKDIGIPPRPIIIDRIAAEMRNDDPNFKLLAQLIGADVSLAAGLIKTANSAYFGLRSRARSVSESLLMLGLNVTSRAIAGIALRQAFPVNAQLELFWNTSAQVAALSGWLAQRIDKSKLRVDDAYTFGLFRDCGIPVLLRRFPAYGEILAQANDNAEHPFTELEQRDLPTNHAMVGCLLAQNWWLPEETCLAIRHHHDLTTIDLFESGLPMASRYLIAASQTAEHLLQEITGRSHSREWLKLGPSCLRLLDLVEDDLPALYREGAEVVAAVE